MERLKSTETNYRRHPVKGVSFFDASSSLASLETSITKHFETSKFLYILINFGVHYNNLEIFSKTLASVLPALDEYASHPNIVVSWMQSFPQHWNTSNGYWDGKKTPCVPIKDTSFKADWRNFLVEETIRNMSLTNIHIIRHREQFIQLHKLHTFGDNNDCTHYCWSPLLYQFLFKSLDDNLTSHMEKYKLVSSSPKLPFNVLPEYR